MAIDWDKIEKENTHVSKYKDYAPEGTHTTRVKEVVAQAASTGTEGIRFVLADNDEYAFPKYGAVAWVSKKEGWRIHHMKELFIVLGFTEAQARKAVEQCEGSEDLADAYLTMFEKALPKAKEVEVAVYRRNPDDQYTTWDFASEKVRMGRPEKAEKKEESILDDATEISDEDAGDIPF